MKVWLTTNIGDKIIKSYVYTPQNFCEKDIAEYTKEICNELDEPTPLFLNKHFEHLHKFNNTNFTQTDFVESVYFDSMNIQIFDENEKKKKNEYY